MTSNNLSEVDDDAFGDQPDHMVSQNIMSDEFLADPQKHQQSIQEVRRPLIEQTAKTPYERIRKGKLVKGTRVKGFKNQQIASTLINFNKRNKDIISQRQ